MAQRPVTVLGAGGTIAMAGPRAVPRLDAAQLVAAVPGLAEVAGLEARTVLAAPGAHLTPGDVLALAREARDVAATGRGVVVTHGTDTLEETALLCDLLHGGSEPVVLTGAIRPASAAGADGPANLADAVAAAGSAAAAGAGVLVAFAGELHAARDVRKVASASPRAFGSPRTGPLGGVHEGRVRLDRRPARLPVLDPAHLDLRIPVVPTWLGDDGAHLRRALQDADGAVVVALGAGHVPPAVLDVLAAATVPVVATTRPEDGTLLHGTYGFRGAEGDLRGAVAACCAALAPQGARIALLAALGCGLEGPDLAAALAPFDA